MSQPNHPFLTSCLFIHPLLQTTPLPFVRKIQSCRHIQIQRGHQLDVFLNRHTESLLSLAGDTPEALNLNSASELHYAAEELFRRE